MSKKLTRAQARALITRRARAALQMITSIIRLSEKQGIPERDLAIIFVRDVYGPWKGRRLGNEAAAATAATIVATLQAMPAGVSMSDMTVGLGAAFGMPVMTVQPPRRARRPATAPRRAPRART